MDKMTMRIDMDKADGTFLPGEKITGTIVIFTDKLLNYESTFYYYFIILIHFQTKI